jgi:hypothetical protein
VNGNEALSILVDAHLDTVSFVMDHVEFRIGCNMLRASLPLAWSFMTLARRPCRLIDSEVAAAQEVAIGQRLEVRTSSGDLLVVDGSDYPYPEFAHLVPADEGGPPSRV